MDMFPTRHQNAFVEVPLFPAYSPIEISESKKQNYVNDFVMYLFVIGKVSI